MVDPIKDVQKQKKQSEIFQVATVDIPLAKIKLPSIDACFKPFNKFPFRSTNSLEKCKFSFNYYACGLDIIFIVFSYTNKLRHACFISKLN